MQYHVQNCTCACKHARVTAALATEGMKKTKSQIATVAAAAFCRITYYAIKKIRNVHPMGGDEDYGLTLV